MVYIFLLNGVYVFFDMLNYQKFKIEALLAISYFYIVSYLPRHSLRQYRALLSLSVDTSLEAIPILEISARNTIMLYFLIFFKLFNKKKHFLNIYYIYIRLYFKSLVFILLIEYCDVVFFLKNFKDCTKISHKVFYFANINHLKCLFVL